MLDVVPGTLKFVDQDNNGVIDANEKCVIRFQVKNSGRGEGHACVVRTKCTGHTQGIAIADVHLPVIPVGKSVWVEIPIIMCNSKYVPIEADAMFPDADEWESEICGIRFKGMRTPGHTKGSVCLLDEEHKVMFTGDTIFAYGCGRMDFPGGSEEEMAESVTMLIGLDEDITVYSGHGMADSMKNIASRWK